MFQDSEIILRENNFSDFQTNLGPGIAMRFQRQKLPFTCNQRRRTLLFGSHGKGTGARVSHCDAGVPVKGHGLLGQEVSGAELRGAGRHWGKIPGAERRGAERRGAGRHWGIIPGAERRGAGGQWGRTSWGRTSLGRTSLGQNPWGRTSWGRRSVGQDVVGQTNNETLSKGYSPRLAANRRSGKT